MVVRVLGGVGWYIFILYIWIRELSFLRYFIIKKEEKKYEKLCCVIKSLRFF